MSRSAILEQEKSGIGQAELLDAFTPGELKKLYAFSSRQHARAGSLLFGEGEACTALHMVLSGSIKVSKFSATGKEQVLRFVGPGQLFGAAAVFGSTPMFPASATAAVDSAVLIMPKGPLLELVGTRPELGRAALGVLAGHLIQMTQRYGSLSSEPIAKRLATMLLEQARAEGGPRDGQVLRLGRPKSEIAALLGTAREVLCRCFKGLKQQGLIDFKGSTVVLLAPDKLASL